jgi:hypothetical protein
MGKGFNIPWVGGQNTMGRGFNIPWVGGQNTMGRGVDIAWVRGSIYHGMEAKNILSTILVMHKKNENNKGCFLLFVINYL